MAPGVDVPAFAAVPHGQFEHLLKAVVEAAKGVLFQGHALNLALAHEGQAAANVGDLAFQHVDDGVVAQVGVGAIKHEEIGKARHGDAQIGCGTLAPGLVQLQPRQAADAHGSEEISGGETGTANESVHLMLLAVFGFHSLWRDPGDGSADEGDVVLIQAGQIVAAQQDAFTANGVVRNQFFPQLRRIHLPLQQSAKGPADHGCHEPAKAAEGQAAGFKIQEDLQPIQLGKPGKTLHQAQLRSTIGAVFAFHDVVGAALEHQQLSHLFGNFRHELHCRGAGADDGHGFAAKVVVVIPAGRVKTVPLETVQARNMRPLRSA